MHIIAHNDTFIERSRRTHTPHYLTFRDDQRPACTLVLGDGFTQGLLRAVDLHSIITCGVNSLIPAPSHVSYFPVAGDRFGRDELFWDPAKWPLVSQAAESCGLAGIELFNAIGANSDPINPDRSSGSWSFATNSLGFELRCYLWHLFRSFEISSGGWPLNYERWGWLHAFHLILRAFKVSIVSFNYDLFLERFVYENLPGVTLHSAIEEPAESLQTRPANSILLLKPHGSISHFLNLQEPVGGLCTANPWLDQREWRYNRVFGAKTEPFKFNLDQLPTVPDLVPPGRQGDDICNPASRANETSKILLSQSQLAIVCGLSGQPPDTAEIHDLLGSVNPDATALHVGLTGNNDQSNNVGTFLQGHHGDTYRFFDADELHELIAHVQATFGVD